MVKRTDAGNRAMSITQLENKNFNVMEFEGDWHNALGNPELTGTWLIYGPPKHGKTRFTLQLAKYLTRFAKVAYDSLEEGVSETIKRAVIDTNFEPKEKKKIIILHKETVEQLLIRLRRKKSPKIVFIDSLQYTGMNYMDYIRFKDEFPGKLFIFISHSDGKLPAGQVARRVQFDANIYIRVAAFKAYATGRYGGGQVYTIWEEGALKY
ncbi:MAG: hypothetical protein WCR72_13575 [Bacteroidota bacterium]